MFGSEFQSCGTPKKKRLDVVKLRCTEHKVVTTWRSNSVPKKDKISVKDEQHEQVLNRAL